MSPLWAAMSVLRVNTRLSDKGTQSAGVQVYTLRRQADREVVVKTDRADFVLNYSSA